MKEGCHFVYVFLFQIVEVGQPTDGQKKAEKIKASFQNPFQKVRCRYYYQVPVSFYNFWNIYQSKWCLLQLMNFFAVPSGEKPLGDNRRPCCCWWPTEWRTNAQGGYPVLEVTPSKQTLSLLNDLFNLLEYGLQQVICP